MCKFYTILTRGLSDLGYVFFYKQSIFHVAPVLVQRQTQICCVLLTGTYNLSVYVTNLLFKLRLLKSIV